MLTRFLTVKKLATVGILSTASGAWYFTNYCDRKKSHTEHLNAQNLLLKTHIKNTQYETKSVKLPSGNFINTFHTQYDPNKKNLVLVHGWGAGLALWGTNIDELSKEYNVYALDLLGFGRSSRPKFKGTTADQARDFWITSLEQWRKVMGLEKFVLLGHSLGGFLVTQYALDHPEYVDKLILAAPVGIAPWIWRDPAVQDVQTTILNTVLFGPLNLTPQGILRSFGPWKQNVWKWVGAKSGYRELDENAWNYLYWNQVGGKSGELAFVKMLDIHGWKLPLFDKLKGLKAPLRVIYGERDYVRWDFGPTIVKHLAPHVADYTVIEGIGHHMYWKRKEFAEMIVQFDKKIDQMRSNL